MTPTAFCLSVLVCWAAKHSPWYVMHPHLQNDNDYFLVLELFDFSLDNWIFHAKQPQFDEVDKDRATCGDDDMENEW